MKKTFLVITVLLIYMYTFAETVATSSDTISDTISYKNDNNIQMEASTEATNYNQIEQYTKTITQIQKTTDTINTSTKTIDITKPLKYKEAKLNNIEVSSNTVIPDENELGTYFSSGAIVEQAKPETSY